MTIGTLSARIMMDASGVKSGLGLTRAEMKLTRQAFLDSTSDVQKLETALATLASARDKGAFANEEQYAAAIAAVRAELDPTVVAQQALSAAVDQQLATIQQSIATYGMSAEELTRYQLAQQGASVEQLASVQAAQQQLQALREQTAAAKQAATAAEQVAAAERAAAAAKEAAAAATAAAVDRSTAALQEEIATRGMSADQIELWRLQQAGASDESVQAVAALQRQAQALRQEDAATAAAAAETNRLETEVEQAAQALRTEAATAGMTADQIQLYKLQTQGATAAQVQMVRQLQAQRTAAQQAAGGHRDLAGGLQNVIQGAGGAIPGVSGLTNTLQLGHPVLIGAAVAIAGLAIAYKAARAAVDWYVAGVGSAMDSIDQMSKEARTLGTTVQDLREVKFAMDEIAGIDASSADRQMEKLSKAVADANAGVNAQAKAFQRLGLDSRAFADASATETIKAIAGAMDQIPSRTERIRIAQQLFGKDSADLVNFLVAGKAAIDESSAALRTYGGVIRGVDSQQVEANKDAWGRVSMTLAGLTEQAAIDLAPALQVAAEKVLELLDPGTTSGQSLRMVLDAIPPALALIIDLSDIMIGNFQLAEAGVMAWANGVIQAAAGVDKAIAAALPGVDANAGLQAWAADYSRQTELALSNAEKRIASGFSGGAKKSIADAAAKAKEAADALAANKPNSAEAQMLKDMAAAAQQQLGIQTDETTGKIREQAAAVTEWDDALTNAASTMANTTFADPLTDMAAGNFGGGMGLLDQFDEFTKEQDALAQSLGSVKDRLAEQIEYWSMDAEAVELAKLAKAGATDQELDELRGLQNQLKELQRQKESLKATDTTIGAGSMSDAYDAIQRFREAGAKPVDRYAGIGDPVPAEPLYRYAGIGEPIPVQVSQDENQPTEAEQQVPLLERIAKGVEAWLAKEGIVVEEVRI